LTEHDNNMKDLAAMFAMCGIIMRGNHNPETTAEDAFRYADEFMKARSGTEQGIAAIKRKKKSDPAD